MGPETDRTGTGTETRTGTVAWQLGCCSFLLVKGPAERYVYVHSCKELRASIGCGHRRKVSRVPFPK